MKTIYNYVNLYVSLYLIFVPFMILGFSLGYFYNFLGYIGEKICDISIYLEKRIQKLENILKEEN
jgi:hypothetical protein